MARHAEGWRLVWRRGIARVRFRYEDRRLEITTGTRDPRTARTTAARIYAEVIGGRRARSVGLASTQSLKDAIAEWILSLRHTLDPRTVREYEIYAAAHWLSRWAMLGEITTQAIGVYQRERLAKVTRTTLRKELSAMRGMLRWCVEQGALGELPVIPDLSRQATGTRATPAVRRVAMSEREAARLIRAMPEGHVRDYVEFAWETGLRPVTIFRLRSPDHWARGRESLTITEDVDKARFARELPLSSAAIDVLERRSPHPRSRRLFVGRCYVLDALREKSAAILGRRIGLYDLRHSRITLLVEAGGPLTGVQYLAGHKHLSTTARYAHAGRKAAEAALSALTGPGPRKRRKGAA